jgi:ATP-dependent helicase/nuclease subunit A
MREKRSARSSRGKDTNAAEGDLFAHFAARVLPDQAARDVIEQRLDVNVLVEAGAGSGKTESLARRMVAGIAGGVYEVDGMAAVTFTRKAAAELRGRFQLALEKRLTEERDEKRKERVRRALAHLERLFAGTIHSFCARLLRERPVEARMAPGFVELDEAADAALRAEAWRAYVAREIAAGSEALARLREAEIAPEHLDDAFETVCLHPEVEFPPGDGAEPATAAAWRALEEFWARLGALLPASIDPGTKCKVQKTARAFGRSMERADRTRPAALARLFREWERDPEITQKWWAADLAAQRRKKADVLKLLADFQRDTITPFLAAWRRHVYFHAVTLLADARAFAEDARRAAVVASYGDLLQCAARLLRERPDVRDALRRKYRWLFVDESQDTDPLQAEVVVLLAADGAESDWTRARLRPGVLFVVGDPKQSIFRFTRADIEVHNRLRELIRASGGETVELTASFRATPALCAWTNGVFARELPAAATAEQAAFQKLAPVRGDSEETGVRTLTLAEGVPARDVAATEADAIARYIRAAVDGGRRRYRDFLILTRKKTKHLLPYAAALDRLDIPVDVSGAGAFGESPAVAALAAALHALADPDDAVAVVGVLRGPLFGVSDEELFAHRQKGLAFTLGAPLPDAAAGPAAAAIRTLKELYHVTRTLPAGAAVERILEETGLLAAAAAESPAGAEAGNLLRAVDRVRQVVESGGGLADAARALEEDIDRGEVEAVPLEPARGDVVRLMNLHRAKGLEAPVVFLANPLAGVEAQVDIRIVRDGARALGYLQLKRRRGEWSEEVLGEPNGWAAHEAAELRYLQAEETRLLYVAATRARETLVIGRWAKTGGKTVRPWQAFDAHLAGVPELGVPQTASPPAPRAIDAGPELRAAAAIARAARLAAACRPSWKVEAVTAGETGPRAPATVARDGTGEIDRGRDWGTLVHGLLEHAMRGPRRDRNYLERLAAWLALDKSELQQVLPQALDTVERVMASEIWTRAMAAEERYAEVPFAVQLDGGSGVPVVVQGVIDLVYRTPQGWEAVDYKTDDPEGRLDALVAAYRPQVTAYARHWGSLVGAPVRAGLFFVRSGAVKWLEGGA